MNDAETPKRILLQNQGKTLVLEYASGDTAELSAEYLRVCSPSAEVQGHGPDDGELPVGKLNVAITKIEQAGHYALRLHFDDDHDSGIYSWGYFKELADEKEAKWQEYLDELQKMGETRDPDTQVVKLLDPTQIN